mgnify:CR=1 FL=1
MHINKQIIIYINLLIKMKYQMSAAVAALISNTNAVKIQADPDVWGPNGANYNNSDARYDVSLIGIDITKQAAAGTPTCQPGDWVTAHWTA